MRVKGVGSLTHESNEYILLPLYIPAMKNGRKVLCKIQREIHLVHNLKAHLLIGNDILGPEKIIINIAQNQAYIGSCEASADIIIKHR